MAPILHIFKRCRASIAEIRVNCRGSLAIVCTTAPLSRQIKPAYHVPVAPTCLKKGEKDIMPLFKMRRSGLEAPVILCFLRATHLDGWLHEFLSSPDFPEISGIRWNLGKFGEIREISGKLRGPQWNSVGVCMKPSMNSVDYSWGISGQRQIFGQIWGGFGDLGGQKAFAQIATLGAWPATSLDSGAIEYPATGATEYPDITARMVLKPFFD